MKKVFIFGLVLISLLIEYVVAQDYENGVPYQMGQIYEQMSDQISDIPANVRRLAVYKLNYNPMRFTVQEVEYIRGEIEAAIREYTGLTVLSPPELEPNDKMKIIGNDSTLQILNIQGRSLADTSPELLTQIASNYGVQGLLEVSMQKRNPDGLILSLRLINPSSREIIWTKSFISNPFKVELEVDKGFTKVFTFGSGSIESESIASADTSLSSQVISIKKSAIVYSASFTYRQSIGVDNSAYLGFTSGLNVIRSANNSSFDLTMFEFGVTYYQSITDKNLDINDYKLMLFFNSKVSLPMNKTKGEFYSFKPGVMLNMSKNLGLVLYTDLILSGETLTLKNNDKITFGRVGYGLQAVVRF